MSQANERVGLNDKANPQNESAFDSEGPGLSIAPPTFQLMASNSTVAQNQGGVVQRQTDEENVLATISQYDNEIRQASQRFGISVEEIKAIMAVESRGDVNASSGVAFGLMQVTSSTWQDTLNNFPDLANYPFSMWRNPLANIMVGTAAFLLKTRRVGLEQDNPNFASVAIAAYNAGEGTIGEAMRLARAAGHEDPAAVCLRAEYLKPAIIKYDLQSYYRRPGRSEEQAVELKFREISQYPEKVERYLAIQGFQGRDGASVNTAGDGNTVAIAKGTITGDSLRVRRGPGTWFSAESELLNSGNTVDIYQVEGDWVRIGVSRWIHKDFVNQTPTGNAPRVPAARQGVVTGSDLNVRSGPGTSFPVAGQLQTGAQVTIHEERSGFYRIGNNRWVSAQFVEVVSSESSESNGGILSGIGDFLSGLNPFGGDEGEGSTPSTPTQTPDPDNNPWIPDFIEGPLDSAVDALGNLNPFGRSNDAPTTTTQSPPATAAPASSGAVRIGASVGRGGTNNAADVRTIQNALNRHGFNVQVDGDIGSETIGAIEAFQQRTLGWSDGRVDPTGQTITALNNRSSATASSGNRVTIGASVGSGGVNNESDVRVIQTALRRIGLSVSVDGAVGSETIEAISKFQQAFLGWADGRVDPVGQTIDTINKAAPGSYRPTSPPPARVSTPTSRPSTPRPAESNDNDGGPFSGVRDFVSGVGDFLSGLNPFGRGNDNDNSNDTPQRDNSGRSPSTSSNGSGGNLRLGGSVGLNGDNREADVRAVQQALRRVGMTIEVDGQFGGQTLGNIFRFQEFNFGGWGDGLISPDGNTLKKLNSMADGAMGSRQTSLRVTWGPNAVRAAVSDNGWRVLEQIAAQAGIGGFHITSTYRGPYDQARVMYEWVESAGWSVVINTYGRGGQAVLREGQAVANRGGSRNEIIAAMAQKVRDVGPTAVSNHGVHPDSQTTVDIDTGSVGNTTTFRRVVDNFRAQGKVSEFLHPWNSSDPAFHIVIPR